MGYSVYSSFIISYNDYFHTASDASQLDAQIFVYALNFFFFFIAVIFLRELLWLLTGTKSGLRNMYHLCPWIWDFKKKGIR